MEAAADRPAAAGFRYLRDPLFVLSVALYIVNRWILKSIWTDGFVHDHLNDLICIPFWVPIMLWAARRLGLRAHDGGPSAAEIVVPLLLWSVVFEVWLPHTESLRGRTVGDPADVLWYAVGALAAGGWWTFGAITSPPSGD
jgi:hypothetical protein